MPKRHNTTCKRCARTSSWFVTPSIMAKVAYKRSEDIPRTNAIDTFSSSAPLRPVMGSLASNTPPMPTSGNPGTIHALSNSVSGPTDAQSQHMVGARVTDTEKLTPTRASRRVAAESHSPWLSDLQLWARPPVLRWSPLVGQVDRVN